MISFLAERGIAAPDAALRGYVEWVGPRELVGTTSNPAAISLQPIGARDAPAP